MAETSSGLLTWVGLQNPARVLPRRGPAEVPPDRVPVVASVAGTTLEEYIRVASRLQGNPGVVALEV